MRGEANGMYTNATTITAAHAITWGGTTYNIRGTVPDLAQSRVTGAAWRFTFNAVGDPHDLVFNVMELPPHTRITADFTNYPTAANVGPTTIQREVFNARSFMLHSGETVQLTAYPMDTRATDFMTHNVTRGDSSLSSYVAWWYGARNSDQMILEAINHFEFVVPSAASAPTATFNTAVVKPDTGAFDKAMSMLTDAQAVGLNVVKAPSGTVSTVFDSVLNTFNSALKSAAKWGLDSFTSYMFGGGLGGGKWTPFHASMALGARRRPAPPIASVLNQRLPWQVRQPPPEATSGVINDNPPQSARCRSQSMASVVQPLDFEEEEKDGIELPTLKPPQPSTLRR